jgi:hypothetical protein
VVANLQVASASMVWRGPHVRAISPARPLPQKMQATDHLPDVNGKRRILLLRHIKNAAGRSLSDSEDGSRDGSALLPYGLRA